jgi:hypothetical protein
MSNSTARKSASGAMKTSRSGTRILALEPRYVFDAAIGAELHHQIDTLEGVPVFDSHAATVSSEDVATAARVLMQQDVSAATELYRVPGDFADVRPLASVIADHNQAGTQTEIAFVDSRLADLSTLINDIPDNVRIVLIDPSRDGVAQMVEALKGESGVTAIHILSHGSDGHIDLGASVLDERTMSTVYKAALTSIAANLSANADILVYGCDFGSGDVGARAAAALADLTGADVASSTNLTGGAAGADWVLEKATGTIDEKAIVAADWNHDLLDISASDGAASGIRNTDLLGDLSSQVTALNPTAPVTFTVQTITTAHGSVTIAANGTYTYTPNAGYLGTDSFIFEGKATDPVDLIEQTATAVETITIGPDPGYAIHAADETNPVGFEKSFSGTVVDNVTPSIKGGAITTYTKTGTGPSHGTLVFNSNGTFTYTAAAGFSGQDSFTFSADDADPNSDAASATVYLNVAPKPLISYDYDSYAVTDAPITVHPYVTEAISGSTLTYAVGTSPDGTLTSNGDGTFTFVPNAGFTGGTSVTYTVTDSNGYNSTSTIYFHYSGSGIAPIYASPDTYTIRQGDTAYQGLSYWETNTNAVAATYTITFDTAPTHGTLTVTNPATGAYTYKADPGYLGPDSFQFTVSDQHGQSATSFENINIVPPDLTVDFSVKFAANGAAVPGNLGGETHESAGNTTEVYAIGGQTLVTGATIATPHGVVTITNAATGAYSWQPNAGFSGVEVINWSVKNVWGPGANDFYQTKSSTDTIVSPNKIYAGHKGYAIPEDTPKTGTVTAFSGSPSGTPTYTPTFAASHGTASIDSAGNYSYTPNLHYHGFDKFGYKISNGLGNTATGYVTIYTAGPLVAGNNSPVATAIPDQVNVDKDTPVNVSVASSFTDADSDSMTFVADGLPPGLSMTPAGLITGTIDRSASQGGDFSDGRYTVTVFADDGRGGVAQQTFSWEVTNPAPVAVTEGTSTPYHTPVIVDLLHNDSDPDGDPLTVTSATVPAAEGTVAFNGTNWVFSPAASFKGTATITYSISDGEGGTATSTHTVVVAAPPIAAVNDSYTTPYDTNVPGNAATGDTYAPNSKFTATSTPFHGTVTMNTNGTYTYNPNPDFFGVDTFSYQVKDPTGQIKTAIETITITAPPIAAVDHNYSTPYDTDVPGNAATSDTYAPNSIFTATSTPAHGTVTMNANGTYTYNPNPDFFGVDTFTYQVADPTGQIKTAMETITIVAPPISAVDDVYTTPYDTDLSGNAAYADTYAPNSVFTATSTPAHGTVTMNTNGTYTYNPNPDFFGVDTFTYQVKDPTGQIVTAKETITIVAPPIAAVDDHYSTPYDTDYTGTAATLDTYALNSVFTATSTPAHGTVVMNPDGSYTYNPDINFKGVDSFTYQVKDPTGQIKTATEYIGVDTPAIAAIDHNYTTLYDTNVAGNAATGDTYAPQSVFTATSKPPHGTVVMNPDGTYIYNPDPDFKGVDSFTYQVQDPTGQIRIATETITIAAPAIAAIDHGYTTGYDTNVAGNAATGDTYAPNSVFTASSKPPHGTVVMNPDGTYIYNPDPDFAGVDTFTYQVKDPTGQIVTATETITIAAPAIAAVDDSYTTPFNTALSGNAAKGDTYALNSTFTVASTPAHGTVLMKADGTYTYTPSKNYYGTDTFTYQVKDPTGQTVTATETITIPRPAIAAVNDSYKTPYNTPLTAAAGTGDTYSPGSTFSAVTQPGHGTLTMKPDGTYVFKPAAGFSGKVTFTYKITDPTGQTSIATETIIVAAPALAAHDHTYQAPYEKPLSGNAAASNTFPTGSKFSVAAQPAKGTVAMNPNGTYTYVPPKGFTGTTTFKYQIKDPTGQIVTATEKITISSHSIIVHCLTTFGNFSGLIKPRTN